jgi:fructose-specific phosphotransferase system IIA component
MLLAQFFDEKLMNLDITAGNKIEVIAELADLMYSSGEIEDENRFLDSVIEREGMGSTGIGHGVAIPHGRDCTAKKLLIAFGRSSEGIDFDAIDEEKVRLIFMLAVPKEEVGLYLKVLAELSSLLNRSDFRDDLINAKSPKEVIDIVDRCENKKM